MLKAIAVPRSPKEDVHHAAEIGSLLIEMDRRLKRMKKLDTEIERSRRQTRQALDRLKAP
ncbi:MAG: hypothetical protein HY043_16815 [Verrucomicrobia bacterium]|nr:hypothetical protein [Verrucomicrobiota bacterium]